MSTRTQERAIYDKIRQIDSIAEVEARLEAIHQAKVSPGRPYPDEVRWLCRRKQALEGKR